VFVVCPLIKFFYSLSRKIVIHSCVTALNFLYALEKLDIKLYEVLLLHL
jgi:hypothetical protein